MDAVKRKKKSLKWDFVKYFLICMILILTGSLLLGISADKLFSPSDYVIFFGEEGIFSIRRNAGVMPMAWNRGSQLSGITRTVPEEIRRASAVKMELVPRVVIKELSFT